MVIRSSPPHAEDPSQPEGVQIFGPHSEKSAICRRNPNFGHRAPADAARLGSAPHRRGRRERWASRRRRLQHATYRARGRWVAAPETCGTPPFTFVGTSAADSATPNLSLVITPVKLARRRRKDSSPNARNTHDQDHWTRPMSRNDRGRAAGNTSGLHRYRRLAYDPVRLTVLARARELRKGERDRTGQSGREQFRVGSRGA